MALLRIPPRKQDAFYVPPFANAAFGRVFSAPPVAIKCRWDDVVEEMRTADGETFVSKATIYPDRILKVGGGLRKLLNASLSSGVVASDMGTNTTQVLYLDVTDAEDYTFENAVVKFTGAEAGDLEDTYALATAAEYVSGQIMLSFAYPLAAVPGDGTVVVLQKTTDQLGIKTFEDISNFRGTKSLYIARV